MGKGAHGVFIAIYLSLPVLRILLSKAYRKELVSKFQGFPVFWLLMFPALVLTLVNGIGISSNDNYPVIMTTASILTEGNLELGEYVPCKEGVPSSVYYVRCTAKGTRSAYPLGMVLPMLATFGFARLLQQDLYNADIQWRLSKWTASLLSAFAIALFFLIAERLVSRSAAFFVSYLLIVGSTFTSIISQGPWSHDGVVFGTLALLFLEFNREFLGSKKRVLIYAFLLAWMFSCRLNSVSVLGPLFLYIVFTRGITFGILLGLFSALFYLPLGIYYQSVYGTFFGPQMVMGATAGITANPFWGAMGILFSPAHGLFPYQPWVLLLFIYLVPEVRSTMRDKLGNALPRVLLSAIVLHILIISQWWGWWGGTWGSRLMSEIIPLLAILILFPVEYLLAHFRKLGTKLLYGFIVLSFLMHAPHLFMFASNWNGDPLVGDLEGEARMWDWRSPPFLYPILKKVRPMKAKS